VSSSHRFVMSLETEENHAQRVSVSKDGHTRDPRDNGGTYVVRTEGCEMGHPTARRTTLTSMLHNRHSRGIYSQPARHRQIQERRVFPIFKVFVPLLREALMGPSLVPFTSSTETNYPWFLPVFFFCNYSTFKLFTSDSRTLTFRG
jgi:hypothetical protein